LGAAEKDGGVTFRIQVEPGRVTYELRQGNSWQQLEADTGDFRKVKVVFPKDVRISGFSFIEK
jgi:hypothetical protein